MISYDNIKNVVSDILNAKNKNHPFDFAIIKPPQLLQPRTRHVVFQDNARLPAQPGIHMTLGSDWMHNNHVSCAVIVVLFSDVAVDYYIRESLVPEAIHRINEQVDFELAVYDDYGTSRKEIATHAGLGKIGKNSLFFSKKFGFNCKIECFFLNRNITNSCYDKIFDASSTYRDETDAWKLSMCRDCDICVRSCPVDAFDDYTMTHQGAVRCDDYITPNWNQPEKMCRNCITSCPHSDNLLQHIYKTGAPKEMRLTRTIDPNPLTMKESED